MSIHGTVSKGFERVRDAFEANFREGGEVGAAFCLHVKSRKVVDLWGGLTDVKGKTWKENTPALVFSTTKGATAICAMMLIDQKRLDIDAPVAQYWPEFAAGGKADIPVRMLLNHQAGLPVVDAPLTRAQVLEVTPVIDALAAQTPVWPPGSRHGYHALTYGWLVGELVRRVTGKTIGRFFKDEVAEPLGLEFWIGLPAEVEPRVARLVSAPPPTDPAMLAQMAALFGPDTLAGRALSMNGAMSGPPGDSIFNLPEVHRSEIPAANGITTARSLSRLYAACIGTVKGTRLFGKRTLDKALKIRKRRSRCGIGAAHDVRPRIHAHRPRNPDARTELVRSRGRRWVSRIRRFRQRRRIRLRDEPDGQRVTHRSARRAVDRRRQGMSLISRRSHRVRIRRFALTG